MIANELNCNNAEASSVIALKLDVSDREAVTAACSQARNKFGDVEILINNAGIV